MARSRRGSDKVERQGQGKINVRLKQSIHNHNYNFMGFDTIEINLVYPEKCWMWTLNMTAYIYLFANILQIMIC